MEMENLLAVWSLEEGRECCFFKFQKKGQTKVKWKNDMSFEGFISQINLIIFSGWSKRSIEFAIGVFRPWISCENNSWMPSIEFAIPNLLIPWSLFGYEQSGNKKECESMISYEAKKIIELWSLSTISL